MDMVTEKWLNGWRRKGGVVWMVQPYCAGCGKSLGVVSVALAGDEVFPDRNPDFPFSQDDCPLCENEHRNLSPNDLARYYSLGELRQALAIKKSAQQPHAGDGAMPSGAEEQTLSGDSSGEAGNTNPPRA